LVHVAALEKTCVNSKKVRVSFSLLADTAGHFFPDCGKRVSNELAVKVTSFNCFPAACVSGEKCDSSDSPKYRMNLFDHVGPVEKPIMRISP
jgi:hypothetical protein